MMKPCDATPGALLPPEQGARRRLARSRTEDVATASAVGWRSSFASLTRVANHWKGQSTSLVSSRIFRTIAREFPSFRRQGLLMDTLP